MPRYAPLHVLLPHMSRTARYRARKKKLIREPDLIINNRPHWDQDRPLNPPSEDAREAAKTKITEKTTA